MASMYDEAVDKDDVIELDSWHEDIGHVVELPVSVHDDEDIVLVLDERAC